MDKEYSSLIDPIKAGDEEAFEELFFGLYEPLCHFALQYVGSMKIAEGIVQDVLANIWETRSNLDQGMKIRAYLYRAVKNGCMDHFRHQKVIQKYETDVEIEFYDDVYEISDKSIAKEGFINAAQDAIEDLPDHTRRIYKLSRSDGLTYREIAEVLDISIKTVESHISKALRILRNQLSRYLPAILYLVIRCCLVA